MSSERTLELPKNPFSVYPRQSRADWARPRRQKKFIVRFRIGSAIFQVAHFRHMGFPVNCNGFMTNADLHAEPVSKMRRRLQCQRVLFRSDAARIIRNAAVGIRK